jgi:hypothetical protein
MALTNEEMLIIALVVLAVLYFIYVQSEKAKAHAKARNRSRILNKLRAENMLGTVQNLETVMRGGNVEHMGLQESVNSRVSGADSTIKLLPTGGDANDAALFSQAQGLSEISTWGR